MMLLVSFYQKGRIRTYVAFSTWLDPDESILKRVTRIGRRSHTESGTNDIAPITPGILLSGLDSISS
jgi:hypothetical protein